MGNAKFRETVVGVVVRTHINDTSLCSPRCRYYCPYSGEPYCRLIGEKKLQFRYTDAGSGRAVAMRTKSCLDAEGKDV